MDRDPARAKAEIEDVERIARTSLSEVREAIAGYRTGNLLAELDHAQSTLEGAGIVVERHCEAVTMPVTQQRVLAMVLREAVTNVLRHAHAERCGITLRETGGVFQLEIRDDGRGGTHQEGMGMRGIRERVAAIGGEVSWSTGLGTVLTIVVPIAANAGSEV
jgi:two-component system, NarL family, sensor histidine kinase DesK